MEFGDVVDLGVETASAAVGAGSSIGSLALAGGGLSAAGISHGLAVLGGSMLGGILVVPAIGFLTYKATKIAIAYSTDSGEEDEE